METAAVVTSTSHQGENPPSLPVRLGNLNVVDAAQPCGESGDVVSARLWWQGPAGNGPEELTGEEPSSLLSHVGDDLAGAVVGDAHRAHRHDFDAVADGRLPRGRIVC